MPLTASDEIQPLSPSGHDIQKEALTYIRPGPYIPAHERIQIYNQQYWWRLVNTLQESYGFLLRLFGYDDFTNRIAVPYLLKNPPYHWSLDQCGNRLVKWVEEDYWENDRPLVLDAARIDLASTECFIAKSYPPLTFEQLSHCQTEDFTSLSLYLQPYIRLLRFRKNLPAFRELMLKEKPEFWQENPFPDIPEGDSNCYIIYRNRRNTIRFLEVSPAEFRLLVLVQAGHTLDEACRIIENEPFGHFQEALMHISAWIQSWTIRGWLTLSPHFG